MTDQPPCLRCGQPTHDQAYVCPKCGGTLRHELGVVATIAGEATTTIAGLDRIGVGSRRTDPNPPLPIDLAAAADHDAAVGTLTTWARHIHEQSGRPLPVVRTGLCDHATCALRRAGRAYGPVCAKEPPEHPTAVLAGWMATQVDWLRHRHEAGEAFDELLDACSLLQRVVDRPAARWYAGPCVCGSHLYPRAGAKVIRCGDCHREHDPQTRKAEMLDRIEDEWAIPEQISHVLTALGVKCTSSMVRGYAFRGRLAPHPELAGGRRRYRIGSVRELVYEQREQERVARLRKAVRDAEEAERRRQHQPTACLTA